MKNTSLLLSCLLLASTARAEGLGRLTLALPDKPVALQLELGGYELKDRGFLPGFAGQKLVAAHPTNRMIVSAFMVPAKKALSSEQYREKSFADLKRGPFQMSQVKRSRAGDWALLEYRVKDVEGFKGLNQQNTHAYLVKGDLWLDYHLSKVDYKDQDRTLFAALIDSIRVVDGFQPASIDRFLFGSYFFKEEDFGKAISHYSAALAQEKVKAALPPDLWLVLVDNLGMAYGITGDLARSRETLEYGLSKKPRYPMFHYNLACTKAEAGDLDGAIASLSKAFENKAHGIKGETIPDPRKDSSFKKYLDDPRFQKAVARF